jgi:hypothetical protein
VVCIAVARHCKKNDTHDLLHLAAILKAAARAEKAADIHAGDD